MSRASASSNQAVVKLLCKYLNLLTGVNVIGEQFRLAKLNDTKENCVAIFWLILKKLCSATDINIFPKEEELVTYVKLHFCYLDYHNVDFYSLPVDMTRGSRELLLAFGWIVSTQNILEKLVQKKIMNSSLSLEYGVAASPEKILGNSLTSNGTVKDENYILWLAGKLKNNIREIAEAEQERTDLLSKLHKDSLNTCGLPHISVADAKLLSNSELLNSSLEPIEAITELIETRKEWQRKCHVFWKWLETVLEKKEENRELSSFGNDERLELIRFMNVLREKIKLDLNDSGSKTNIKDPNEPSAACVLARRLIFHKKSRERTEVEKWLENLQHLVHNLEEECVSREKAVGEELERLADKLVEAKVGVPLPKKISSNSP